jgi:hypothetical protein
MSTMPKKPARRAQLMDGIPLRMWYASTPFDIVCVADRSTPEDGEEDDFMRERPLLAVDFGHAVWIEWFMPPHEEEVCTSEVEPAVEPEVEVEVEVEAQAEAPTPDAVERASSEELIYDMLEELHDDVDVPVDHRQGMERRMMFSTFPTMEIDAQGRELNLHTRSSEASVRELEVPEELDLGLVETINIDQSQGAVFMSVRSGQIFVVYYE